jgi:hypothetical protein
VRLTLRRDQAQQYSGAFSIITARDQQQRELWRQPRRVTRIQGPERRHSTRTLAFRLTAADSIDPTGSQNRSNCMKPEPRKLVNLAWAVVSLLGLAALYVLSYAPVYRLSYGPDPAGVFWRPYDPKPWQSAYAPVEWLIDTEPSRTPLIRWAEICGVGSMWSDGIFRLAEAHRTTVSTSCRPLPRGVQIGSYAALVFCVFVFIRYCLPALHS